MESAMEAYWFYIDFFHGKMRPVEFLVDLLNITTPVAQKLYDDYSQRSCAGCILFNDKKEVLLVNTVGVWLFPKGKQREGEPLLKTAARETFEETGYHVKGRFRTSIDVKQKKTQLTRMFVYDNVPEFVFQPQTRNEINAIKWVKIEDIPTLPGNISYLVRNCIHRLQINNAIRNKHSTRSRCTVRPVLTRRPTRTVL